MNQIINGEIAYTEVTPLGDDEKAWLLDCLFPDILDLPSHVKKHMFLQLWNPDDSIAGDGHCMTCGDLEGECLNSTCIRTRITNKLMLSGMDPT